MDFILHDYSWNLAKQLDCPYEYILKTVDFANKTTDLIMTKIKRTVGDLRSPSDGVQGFHTFVENGLSDEEKEAKRQENISRSIRRAEQQVKYAVRQCGADHMVTLTTRENMVDRDQFFAVFKRFIRLVREKDLITINGKKCLVTRSEKRNYLYVAVPEFQKRGAYHMHLACVGKQDLYLLNACWYVALGGSPNDKGLETKGAVNVQFRQKRWGALAENHNTMSLVQYMIKYITKSFSDIDTLGLARYKRAHSIEKPIINKQFIWSSYANNRSDFVGAIQEVYAIANFMGLKELEPYNDPKQPDFFVLRGIRSE